MHLQNSSKSTLTPSQTEAVNSILGPVMCIAGPGSGKTLTIVHRLICMIKEHNIEPTSILVVTFTRAAAVQMRSRFLGMCENENPKVNFGTFHSIFFQLLKQHFGYTSENIVSEDGAYKIMLSLLSGRDEILSANPDIIRRILDEIAYVKSSRKPVSEYKSPVIDRDTFTRLYNDYNRSLEDLGLLDFEDMLNKTYELLTENPGILKHWQNKFKYILVDEFQDINLIQYEITKMLAYPENNLFVVGDDDQSIYSFRGAAPEIMQQFPRDYANAKKLVLDTNFRCSGPILSAALKVIANNRTRYEKKLVTANPDGSRVILKGFEDSFKEHNYLSKLLAKELDKGKNPNELAVLCRTNAQCSTIARVLAGADIPFNVKGGISTIYDNRYVLPIIAYIRFLSGDFSRANFLHFCNKPVRYITRESLSEEEISLDALQEYYKDEEKYYVLKNLKQLIYDIHIMKNLNTSAVIHYIRRVVGYEDYLKNTLNLANDFYEEILEYLDELEQDAVNYPSFTAFLTHITESKHKISELKEKHPVSAVNLVTYHGCKGLEYDYVYMPDCMEGVTPHGKSASPELIEEERRMFYVAMTRAKSKLYLSYSAKRHGKTSKCSRFIDEIRISGEPLQKGSRIIHESYKEGTVIAITGDMISVKFDNLLVPKKLSYKFCVEKSLIQVIG